MDEHHHAQFLGLGPERVELGVADLVAGDIAADRRPAQAVLLDAFLELLGGEIGKLQGDGGEGDKAVGMRGTRLGQLLVLDLDDLLGKVAIRLYQFGLMLSASMSMPCSSIASSRAASSVAMSRSGRSAGPPSFRFISANASGTAQCACTSTVLRACR